ncbi:long-chain fatty acid--CoA ligase [Salinadaptatus halalkaliphilus]|uniref:Long-chain fatty acid--CoA ligase n=1 Tax=Salinadaptatus halalkaliphilus TaxID=2419781 RepID=A0A4S3TM17_9EURY|nr:AMP-binding protein [Salinadaptatus halalkaliphilus]THE64045.1 long-chain fatty acid--CoA ligase [Salinadaptatus halalkaliphilus]
MQGLTLSWLAERNAYKFPEKEAIVMTPVEGGRTAITNATFDERINQVANGLRKRGIDRGDKVAVYTTNSIPTLEMYLGAMRIGALPVPVNHRFKADEVRYVLEDSDAELLLFDDQAADIVDEIHDEPTTPDEMLFYGTDRPAYADDYVDFREQSATSAVEIVSSRVDEAMLMYTSGTTGDPKGCLLTHDNVIQMSVNGIVEKAFEGRDVDVDGRGMIVTPLFHISAFGMFINNYYAGATTVLMDGFEPNRVMSVLEDEAVTAGFFVPTMARALLAVEDFEEYDLSAFEEFGIGAAPSGKELKATISAAFDAELQEAFGQTEMSPVTTLLQPSQALDHADTVGKPVINVLFKVIDPDTHEEVEPGEIGQVCYRGPTMFNGYYGMPEKTDEVFDEDGFFISGDLVRQDEDGFVEFIGRADNMIITGGENVYPAEIEETLHEHPAVDEVAIVGAPDDTWGERIKAAIVPQDGQEPSAEELQTYVGERLADYKKPREFVFLESLPRNPTGKVLKQPLEDEAGEMVGWES